MAVTAVVRTMGRGQTGKNQCGRYSLFRKACSRPLSNKSPWREKLRSPVRISKHNVFGERRFLSGDTADFLHCHQPEAADIGPLSVYSTWVTRRGSPKPDRGAKRLTLPSPFTVFCTDPFQRPAPRPHHVRTCFLSVVSNLTRRAGARSRSSPPK